MDANAGVTPGTFGNTYDYIQYSGVDAGTCNTKCDAANDVGSKIVGLQYDNGPGQECRCLFDNDYLENSDIDDCAIKGKAVGLPDTNPNSCDDTKVGTGPVSQGDGNSNWTCHKAIAAVSQIRAMR